LVPFLFHDFLINKAAWIRVRESVKNEVEAQDLVFRAGSHAASHTLLNVAPLYITCNASNLGTECANPYDKRDIPERILLYDRHPGGIGLAWQVKFSI
jgi:DEAD/DEAH box helicase domain-containing protein